MGGNTSLGCLGPQFFSAPLLEVRGRFTWTGYPLLTGGTGPQGAGGNEAGLVTVTMCHQWPGHPPGVPTAPVYLSQSILYAL